ncbi:dystrophin-like protein 1 [Ditylenchus destructor]|nr:dystrophin-like protein 1 [Ditylenchus destructor]
MPKKEKEASEKDKKSHKREAILPGEGLPGLRPGDHLPVLGAQEASKRDKEDKMDKRDKKDKKDGSVSPKPAGPHTSPGLSAKVKKDGSVSPRPSRPPSVTLMTTSMPGPERPGRPSSAQIADSQRPSTSSAFSLAMHRSTPEGKSIMKSPGSPGQVRLLRPTPSGLSQTSESKPTVSRTIISEAQLGTGRRTPAVIRTASPGLEGDEDPISIEQQFYYLRLMAKPGSKPEPIKMKFVRWAPPQDFNLSVDDEGTLESQAMRVVRTIGQAFEVCHKLNQEQMQEKQQLEEGEPIKSNSIAEEGEDDIQRQDTVEGDAEGSRSSSPAQPPPPGMSRNRQSVYVPRKHSSDVSSQGTAIEQTQGGAIAAAIIAAAAAGVPLSNSAVAQMQSQASQNPNPNPVPVPASQTFPSSSGVPAVPMPTRPSMSGVSGNPGPSTSQPMGVGTHTLPHSHTWNLASPSNYPQFGPQIGPFPSMQSLDVAAANAQPGYPIYPLAPMSFPGSASMPYGLSSPVVVSPYATLQLPSAQGSGNAEQGDVASALQLSRTLDQYNQQLIRSQLDQAQQSAQVASCQVQLLRDQLTSETTARLEAQSRTHQLLNTNRELLDQVSALVNRLQSFELKLTSEIQMIHTQNQPQAYQSSTLPAGARQPPYPPASSAANTSAATLPLGFMDAKLPGPAPINPQRPYQVQTLADLRGGSVPPAEQSGQQPSTSAFTQNRRTPTSGSKKARRFQDDSGVRTEPDSATEDTTDYSSSDAYEKTSGGLLVKRSAGASNVPSTSAQQPAAMPHYDVLLSNPQVMHNLPSYFHASIQPFMQPPPPLTSTSVASSVSQPQPLVATPLIPSTRRTSTQVSGAVYEKYEKQYTQVELPRRHHRESPPRESRDYRLESQPAQRREEYQPPLPPSVPLGGVASTSEKHGVMGSSPPSRQQSPKKALRRFSLQPNQRLPDDEGEEDRHHSKSKKSLGGVFKEKDVGFSRMSFNTRLNNPGKKPDHHLISVPPASSTTIQETAEEDYPPGFSRDRRRSKDSGSPIRRRSLGAGQARTSISGSSGSPARGLEEMSEKQRRKEAIAATAAATGGMSHGGIVSRAPASSSLATAMYPPIKRAMQPVTSKASPESVKRGGFRALSIEDPSLDEPLIILAPTQQISTSQQQPVVLSASELAAIAAASSQGQRGSVSHGPRGSISSSSHHHHQPNLERVIKSSQQGSPQQSGSPPTVKTSGVQIGNANYFASPNRRKVTEIHMNPVDAMGNAYIHKPGMSIDTSALLNNNNRIVLPDPDSVKGRTLQAMDAKKLSDPALLARLTGQYYGNQSGGKDSEGNFIQPNGVP